MLIFVIYFVQSAQSFLYVYIFYLLRKDRRKLSLRSSNFVIKTYTTVEINYPDESEKEGIWKQIKQGTFILQNITKQNKEKRRQIIPNQLIMSFISKKLIIFAAHFN